MHMVVLLVIVCLFGALYPREANADGKRFLQYMGGSRVWDPSPQELPKIPRYCWGRVGEQKEKFTKDNKRWAELLITPGTNDSTRYGWTSIHHYCAGLVAMLRIEEGIGNRSALANEARSHFDYQIRHSDPSFVLMPEVHLNMGKAYRELGEKEKALASFLEAIKLKADYEAAYLSAADIYLAMGSTSQAVELVEFGLTKSPKSKALRMRLRSIKSGAANP